MVVRLNHTELQGEGIGRVKGEGKGRGGERELAAMGMGASGTRAGRSWGYTSFSL